MVQSSGVRWRRVEEDSIENSSFGANKLDPRVRKIIALVSRGDILRLPRLEDIAESLGISTFRLRHLFKQQVGISFARYLKLLRLQRAKRLLETSFMRVKEVTASVGINDLSHFVRDYEKLFGETPSQTRKRSRA